jgi:alanyl-tRNA synthetase
MKVLSSTQIRQAFIDFFVSQGHAFASPSPVVPQNDPTLLFTNAGMNQFKDVFLGHGDRPYTRAVNSQVCVRVSGKHNDLEDVGFDGTHLTSFEMLGNWSFGDYYKKEAISWAWTFMTEVLKLPKEKLYASIYTTDQESLAFWQTATDIAHPHILFFGDKENFWEMGEVGPCGPCSEIHLDLGPAACNKPGQPHVCGVNGDCARYVELWNLVFIQFNREQDRSLTELPKKHVDTGAGLERLTAVLQGHTSAYDTDLFTPIIAEIALLSGKPYDPGAAGVPFRVMADHIRTLTFGMADNILPANEGRGYVLRRLIRRAARYATQLGFTAPVLYKLVGIVVEKMGDYLPHLRLQQHKIEALIQAEEDSFLRTLSAGTLLFKQLVDQVTAAGRQEIPGTDAFKLYDTYGFPLDLTSLMARELGLQVDEGGYQAALEAQRAQSRKATKLNQGVAKTVPMGGEARIVTDPIEKRYMARHHTATHLLNAALREVLGSHVQQAGSLVDIDRLRFDFSHYKAMTPQEVATVESIVNTQIAQNVAVVAFQKKLDEAKAMGAAALFGEKYDDVVRVIQIGEFSLELCGGTHVTETGEIEAFKLISETAIAAGTRRIEAIAGKERLAAYTQDSITQAQHDNEMRIQKIRDTTHTLLQYHAKPDIQIPQFSAPTSLQEAGYQRDTIDQILKHLEKQLEAIQNSVVSTEAHRLLERSSTLIISRLAATFDSKMSRSLAEKIVKERPQSVVVLLSENGLLLVAKGPLAVTKDGASGLVQKLIPLVGGKGGGKSDFAQAGGCDPSRFSNILDQAPTLLGTP